MSTRHDQQRLDRALAYLQETHGRPLPQTLDEVKRERAWALEVATGLQSTDDAGQAFSDAVVSVQKRLDALTERQVLLEAEAPAKEPEPVEDAIDRIQKRERAKAFLASLPPFPTGALAFPSVEVGENGEKPVLDVFHSQLKKVGASPYKVDCPSCQSGILACTRLAILQYSLWRYDRCSYCAQRVMYLDEQINEEIPQHLPTEYLFEVKSIAQILKERAAALWSDTPKGKPQ